MTQTFPAPAYTTTPAAAPLRGIVAYSISGGVDVYGAVADRRRSWPGYRSILIPRIPRAGPFEAGFTPGQACTTNVGSCDAGIDVGACEAKLKYECGTANFKYYMMMARTLSAAAR